MKCMSCQEEISAKFAHSIAKNECPFCGSKILEEKLQEVLSNLKNLFDEGKEYMPAIEDWLYTNYAFKKITSQQKPISSSLKQGKGASVNRSEGGSGGYIDTENMTEFAKRAGINFKEMVSKIKEKDTLASSTVVSIDDDIGLNDESDDLDDQDTLSDSMNTDVMLEKLKQFEARK